MKADMAGQIDGMKKQAQVMVDTVFSYGELGFQEFETSKYSDRHSREGRFQDRARDRRYSDRVHGDLGGREACNRARLRYR